MFFRVVSCNGPQRFTSGSLYTSLVYVRAWLSFCLDAVVFTRHAYLTMTAVLHEPGLNTVHTSPTITKCYNVLISLFDLPDVSVSL